MPPQTEPAPAAAVPAKKPWGLRLLSVLYGLLIVPGLLVSMGSAFAFDAPGSGNNPLTVAFVFFLNTLPFILAASFLGGLFFSFGKRTPRQVLAGRIFGWLPVANLAIIVIIVALLQVLCGGQFTCHP